MEYFYKLTTNKIYKLCTSLALISFLSFQPKIPYAQEAKSENFFSKLFSKISVEENQAAQNQIFKSDVDSLNIDTLIDFEFSIRDILKNYLEEKNIKKFINNITEKDNKKLNAKTLEEFDKLLPKSSSEKLNGQALIRVAKKLGKDEKTKFEIKKNIVVKIISSFGITVTYSDKVKKKDVVKIDKEKEIDIKKASSSNMPVIAGIAGLGALGGGGGGSSGGGNSSTFLDESTTFSYDANLDATWKAREEYNNSIYGAGNFNGTASTINPYTLVGINNAFARGLSGSGKTIAVYDTDYHSGIHKEFANKNNAGKLTNDGTLTVGSDGTSWHGIHVAGTIAGDYNSNNSNFLSGTFGDDRDYGMMGVAYNASLHLSDFADTSVYANSQDRLNAAITAAKNKNAIAQNNSWGWGTCQTGSGCTTIDELVTYQNNNSTSDAASLAGVLGGSSSKWSDMITAYQSFQNTGVVVFANGNDFNSANASLQPGLPVVATELADAWLTVGNLNINGNTISSGSMTRIGNGCGIAREFCIFADGTDIWSSTGDTNNATDNEYSTYTGSSMAAPIVSGAVALLSEAFPNHTPAQLVDRILASANNDFFTATGTTTFINGITHGYNNEFGHGLLDLAKALEPIQTSSIVVPTSRSGSLNAQYGDIQNARRFDISSSNIRLGQAFGDAIENQLKNTTAYFYDSLNGGFSFNMSSLVKDYDPSNSSNSSFANIISKTHFHKNINDNGFGFITMNNPSENNDSILTLVPISKENSAFFGNNINIQNVMSFTDRNEESYDGINSDNPFSIPFMNASEKGMSAGNKIDLESGIFTFGFFDGETKDYALKTDGLFLSYSKDSKISNTSYFLGTTNETDGFLETSISGAFAERSLAKTNYIGTRSRGWVNSDWSYNSIFTFGNTNFDVGQIGLLDDINDLKSSMFALEFSKSINIEKSIHFGVSQPLRIESGKATILIPQLYDSSGNLTFKKTSLDIEPSGRQIDLSFGYKSSLTKAGNFQFVLTSSKDYNHTKSQEFVNSARALFQFVF